MTVTPRFSHITLAFVLALLSVSLPAGTAAQDSSEFRGPDRSGFTVLTSLGFGLQNDRALDGTNNGLAGLNLGIGGYINDRLALMLRVSGTNADIGPARQTSGFGGPSVQYWTSDRIFIEGGAGVGFWDIEDTREAGLGLLFGVGYTLFNSGSHNFHVGLEYAPAFTDPETVHNFGLVAGWQLL